MYWLAGLENTNGLSNEERARRILQVAAEEGRVPADFENSPYFILDIAWLAGDGIGSPAGRMRFHPWQRDWIIRYNKRLNGGNMESDAWVNGTNEPHQVLLEGGTINIPELDHIVPNLSGGANFFTNCRLVSWDLNNRIERNVNADSKFYKWK